MNKISAVMKKYKLRHDASGFCLENATGNTSSLQTATSVVRNATSVMRICDKCCTKTRQML